MTNHSFAGARSFVHNVSSCQGVPESMRGSLSRLPGDSVADCDTSPAGAVRGGRSFGEPAELTWPHDATLLPDADQAAAVFRSARSSPCARDPMKVVTRGRRAPRFVERHLGFPTGPDVSVIKCIWAGPILQSGLRGITVRAGDGRRPSRAWRATGTPCPSCPRTRRAGPRARPPHRGAASLGREFWPRGPSYLRSRK
jgi:hypothetical protein